MNDNINLNQPNKKDEDEEPVQQEQQPTNAISLLVSCNCLM
jgi:hypothetical protein